MDQKELAQLLERYTRGNCTAREREWVEQWYNDSLSGEASMLTERDLEADVKAVRTRLLKGKRKPRQQWLYYAASVIALIGCGVMLTKQFKSKSADHLLTTAESHETYDILPGGNKAVLTLANGKTIELNEAYSGLIINDDISYEDGSVIYADLLSTTDNEQPTASPVLTLSIPKGGQYQITLADGTKVWMNAASTLTYPAKFTGDKRMVELEGEAYFDVAHNAHTPFIVTAGDQVIEVLGTQFNVSSYRDESAIKTTLVAGSVKVYGGTGHDGMLLKPGQQSSWDKAHELTITNVDVSSAIAWKEGLFSFDNMSIKTMMRQLSRWYNVDVIFEGDEPDIRLWGQMYRDLNASQALELLSYFNLKFRIETVDGAQRIVIFE